MAAVARGGCPAQAGGRAERNWVGPPENGRRYTRPGGAPGKSGCISHPQGEEPKPELSVAASCTTGTGLPNSFTVTGARVSTTWSVLSVSGTLGVQVTDPVTTAAPAPSYRSRIRFT